MIDQPAFMIFDRALQECQQQCPAIRTTVRQARYDDIRHMVASGIAAVRIVAQDRTIRVLGWIRETMKRNHAITTDDQNRI